MRASVMAGVLILVCVTEVVADERKGGIYVTGGITAPYQPGVSGEVARLYIEAPGGVTLGWSFGGGVRVGELLSLEGEWSNTGWMRARERSRSGLLQTATYIEERRDRFAVFAARLHFRRTHTVGFEPLIGLAWTKPEGWSEPEGVPAQRQRVPLDDGIAPVFGCDLRVGGGRFAVMPSFRVFVSDVSTDSGPGISSYYPGGFPSVTLRAGAGVRIDLGRR